MNARESDVCIVTLIGLPASGKTSFVARYRERLKQTRLVHVCYDQLIPLDVQASLAAGQVGDSSWKEEREKVVQNVRRVFNTSGRTESETADRTESETADRTESETADRTESETADRTENETADTTESETADLCQENLTEVPYAQLYEALVAKEKTVVVVDDNNYLPSMRYSYYQLAREHGAGFCQLYFECAAAAAVAANSRREEASRVPDLVIMNMSAKLEPPDPLKNSWEQFSFTLPAAGGRDGINFEMVDAVIEMSFKNAVRPLEDNSEQREADRVACCASVVHQADKYIRKIVNQRMTEGKKEGLDKDSMRATSEKLYAAKTELLEDLKTGFTKLDKELVQAVKDRTQGSGELLENEITLLFKSKLEINC